MTSFTQDIVVLSTVLQHVYHGMVDSRATGSLFHDNDEMCLWTFLSTSLNLREILYQNHMFDVLIRVLNAPNITVTTTATVLVSFYGCYLKTSYTALTALAWLQVTLLGNQLVMINQEKHHKNVYMGQCFSTGVPQNLGVLLVVSKGSTGRCWPVKNLTASEIALPVWLYATVPINESSHAVP